MKKPVKYKLTPEQQEIVIKNKGLVYAYINRITKKRFLEARLLEHDDIVSAGMVGLIRAAILFKPEKGNRFSTYAWKAIHSEIRKAVATAQAVRNPHSAFSKEYKTKAVFTTQTSQHKFDLTSTKIMNSEIPHLLNSMDCKQYLSILSQRHRDILSMVFDHGGSFSAVARLEGVSFQRIGQIVKDSLDKIRRRFNIEIEPKK